ncbi:MAG: TMEM165/GDT1 family protein [Nevskiales bacterium]
MDWRAFLTVFGTIFLAELGDKTQLATVLFAADRPAAKWAVFAAAAGALVLACAIGVLAGGWVAQHVNEKHLKLVACIGLILIGAWTLRSAYTG